MWGIALTLFIAAKCLTIFSLKASRANPSRCRLVEYGFLWPGMDPRGFCDERTFPAPGIHEWISAGLKTLSGAALVWFGVRSIPAGHALAVGWLGMIGLVLLLHFGLFHLLSLLWRAYGINAKPIMQSPAKATSLAKFWGGKWNSAFSDLMEVYLFKPLVSQIGINGALFAVFIFSGAVHELVISLPAKGGYGLPTLYFVIQGLGLLLERSRLGRGIGLGHRWKGWCFVALVTVVPAFWLFHPPFIHNVILPMLHAFGAI